MSELSAVVQSFFDRRGMGKLAELRPLFTDDAAIVTPAGARGIDAHEQMGQVFMPAFPDSHMDVSRMVTVGDEIWVTGHSRALTMGGAGQGARRCAVARMVRSCSDS